jgi:hypothetical protein
VPAPHTLLAKYCCKQLAAIIRMYQSFSYWKRTTSQLFWRCKLGNTIYQAVREHNDVLALTMKLWLFNWRLLNNTCHFLEYNTNRSQIIWHIKQLQQSFRDRTVVSDQDICQPFEALHKYAGPILQLQYLASIQTVHLLNRRHRNYHMC